jgi:hypothetical protein
MAIPIASSVFPTLFCTRFKVLGLKLRFLIDFELILVQYDKHASIFIILQADIQFSQQHFMKRHSFLHHTFLLHLSNITWP